MQRRRALTRAVALLGTALAVVATTGCSGGGEPTAVVKSTTPAPPSAPTPGPAEPAAPSGTVTVTGSEVVGMLASEVARLSPAAGRPPIEVIVDAGGTGDGIFQICRGEGDIVGASRRVTEDERQTCAEADVALISLEVASDGGETLLLYVSNVAAERPEVVDFVDAFLSDRGQAAVVEVGLEALSLGSLGATRQAWAAR